MSDFFLSVSFWFSLISSFVSILVILFMVTVGIINNILEARHYDVYLYFPLLEIFSFFGFRIYCLGSIHFLSPKKLFLGNFIHNTNKRLSIRNYVSSNRPIYSGLSTQRFIFIFFLCNKKSSKVCKYLMAWFSDSKMSKSRALLFWSFPHGPRSFL